MSVPLPKELQVEVTGACNLRCRMCLVRYRPPLDRVTASMSFDRFRALVDSIPGLEVLTLQGLGEPLLAPDLLRMVEYAAARNVRVGFNTNGTLLTEDRAERLIQGGLDWLHISVDGATAETYAHIRGRARLQLVGRNVRRFVEVQHRLGAERPDVQIVVVAMRRNLAELPAIVGLAAEWGVHDVWVQNLSHSFDDTDPSGDYAEIREFAGEQALWWSADPQVEEVLAATRLRASELGVHLRLPASAPPPAAPRRRDEGEPGCDWPWRSGYVRHDGGIQPCCMVMGADRAQLGSLADETFSSAWHGPAFAAFRAALTTEEPPDVCTGCSMYRRVF